MIAKNGIQSGIRITGCTVERDRVATHYQVNVDVAGQYGELIDAGLYRTSAVNRVRCVRRHGSRSRGQRARQIANDGAVERDVATAGSGPRVSIDDRGQRAEILVPPRPIGTRLGSLRNGSKEGAQIGLGWARKDGALGVDEQIRDVNEV